MTEKKPKKGRIYPKSSRPGKSTDLVPHIPFMLDPNLKITVWSLYDLRNYLNLYTTWGSFRHGDDRSLKCGDTRSWYTGERGSICMDFPNSERY